MIRIRIKATGVISEVTPNVAHDLIDRGLAEKYTQSYKTKDPIAPSATQAPANPYGTRQMRPRP